MTGTDFIGDVHGHADALKGLLKKLGYRDTGGAWRHPERQVVFLGDFVDRGPQQLGVLDIARRMCDAGNARTVMGNHEYNAICFATQDPEQPGEFLRPHSKKNRDNHAAFLAQVGENSAAHRDWVAWFKTMPLWIEDDGFRVIHACWHPNEQETLEPYLDGEMRLSETGIHRSAARDSAEFNAVETLLKGLEVGLPSGHSFQDKNHDWRTEVRVPWWQNELTTFRESAVIGEEIRRNLPDEKMPREAALGYHGNVPVFVGHYWLEGEPKPLTDKVACLDYSIAKGGKLCAYRWDGESTLDAQNFVFVTD